MSATSDPLLARERLTARRLLVAAAIYAGLAVLFTWPAVTQLRSHIVAGPWDGPMFVWNTWWGPRALFDLHQDPLSTRHLFFPKGTSLVVNTHALLPSLASWPLQKLFGLVAAFNLMVLLTFVLAGVGGLLLTHEVAGDWRAGLVAGAVFSFGHMRLSTMMFFNLAQNWLLPFWAWALWRALRLRSWKWSLAAGVIGAAVFWTDYNLALFAALWGLAFGVYALIDVRRHGATRIGLLARWGAMALVLGALCFPLVRSLRAEFKPVDRFVRIDGIDVAQESTPVSYLIAWKPAAPRNAETAATPLRQATFIGYATLLLTVFGAWARRRDRSTWFLVVVAALFLLISLGYELNLGDTPFPAADQSFRVRLPYCWIADLPVIREIHSAHRFGIVGWLALSIVAGVGLRELLGRLQASRLGRWRGAGCVASAIACAGVMADFTRLPFPIACELPPIPPPIEAIAADPRECAVLEWPGGREGDPFFAYYDTVHGKPQYLDGQAARPVESGTKAQSLSRIRHLLDLLFRADEPEWEKISAIAESAEQEMRNQKVGWLVLSQFDYPLLTSLREPWTIGQLHAIDARIRRALPGLRCTWLAADPRLEEFVDAPPRKRWSRGTLFAAYRLELP